MTTRVCGAAMTASARFPDAEVRRGADGDETGQAQALPRRQVADLQADRAALGDDADRAWCEGSPGEGEGGGGVVHTHAGRAHETGPGRAHPLGQRGQAARVDDAGGDRDDVPGAGVQGVVDDLLVGGGRGGYRDQVGDFREGP